MSIEKCPSSKEKYELKGDDKKKSSSAVGNAKDAVKDKVRDVLSK